MLTRLPSPAYRVLRDITVSRDQNIAEHGVRTCMRINERCREQRCWRATPVGGDVTTVLPRNVGRSRAVICCRMPILYSLSIHVGMVLTSFLVYDK